MDAVSSLRRACKPHCRLTGTTLALAQRKSIKNTTATAKSSGGSIKSLQNNAVGPQKDNQAPGSVVPEPSASAPPVRSTGLRMAPLGGGVRSATHHYDLPPPPVAVRNLVEQAQFAHLCTVMSNMHHRRAGYPFGTLVDFASDGAGFPIFCLSPLAIHTRNIQEDCRCSLVVQMPGWTGLANARVTIFGDVYQLPPETQEAAQEIFLAKHSTKKSEKWVSGNFSFYRMHRILDIYFVGGFGTVQWIDVAEYAATKPDLIVMNDPHNTLEVMNDTYSDSLKQLLAPAGEEADDAAFISIDALGADIRLRIGSDFTVQRIGFQNSVQNLEEAKQQMQLFLQGASQGLLQ